MTTRNDGLFATQLNPWAGARQRGSMMVMTVVVIVLLTLMGAAFLQMARVQRQEPATTPQNIDTVLEAEIARIKLILKRDLFTEGGELFGTDIEPYDYPNANYSASTSYTDPVTGTPYTISAGQDDDYWLADTAPVWDGSEMVWRKFSSVTGVRVVGNIGDWNDLATGTLAYYPITGASGGGRVEDLQTSSKSDGYVDADGDGIVDSRWERSALPMLEGVQYFAAIRIIDLSSLINVMSTGSIVNNTGTLAGDITGYYPTSGDMGRILRAHGGGAFNTSLDNLFESGGLRENSMYANPLSGTRYPTPLGLTNVSTYWSAASYGDGQIRGWLDGVSLYGNLSDKAVNTLELHYRGGIDDGSRTTALENALGAYVGDSYDEASQSPVTNARNFFENPATTLRNKLTTISGHSPFRVTQNFHTKANYSNDELKGDLLFRHNSSPQNFADELYGRLKDVFAIGGGYSPNAVVTADAAAAAFAANIAEYVDANSALDVAVTDEAGVVHYGLEALPFLREIYMEVGYEDSDEWVGPSSDSTPGTDGAFDTFTRRTNSEAIAIEIGNPFDRPIPASVLNTLRIRVRQGTTTVSSWQMAGVATALASRGTMVIYSNPTDTTNEGTGSTGDLSADGVVPAGATLATSHLRFNADGSQVYIELQILKPGGNAATDADWATYDRITHADMAFDQLIDHSDPADATVAPGAHQHGQLSVARDCAPIRYVSNQGVGPTSPKLEPTAPAPTAYSTTITLFGNDAKGISGDDKLDGVEFQLPIANRKFFSVAELGWIPMFGFTDESNDGSFSEQLSGPDGTSTRYDLDTLFLRFSGTSESATLFIDGDGDGTDDTSYAHLVIDEFTTLNPRYDGADNDVDSSTDESDGSEQFIPGTMNLNTAPLNTVSADDLATFFASYPGTQPETLAVINATRSGMPITSMGQVVSATVSVGSAPIGASHDLYPVYENTAASSATGNQGAIAYAISGDAEEQMKRAQFLLQTFTNRSDIFAASILVKGYSGTESDLDSLIESGRILVIFSRANMTAGTDEVEVLGVYRY